MLAVGPVGQAPAAKTSQIAQLTKQAESVIAALNNREEVKPQGGDGSQLVVSRRRQRGEEEDQDWEADVREWVRCTEKDWGPAWSWAWGRWGLRTSC